MSIAKSNQQINIGLLGEESFKYGTAVLIQSIIDALSTTSVSFYILDLNLSDSTRSKIQNIVRISENRSDITWLKLSMSNLISSLNNISTIKNRNFREQCWFAKFAIPDILRNKIDSIIYVDSDILCNIDFGMLNEIAADHPLCAVVDKATQGHGFSAEFRACGLDEFAPYFNAGLMLINLAYWRKNNLSDAVIKIAQTHGQHVIDQGIFNILYFNNWYNLAYDWNFQCPITYSPFRKIESGEKVNIHYLTNPKPWQVPVTPQTRLFFHFLDRTPFCGWRPNAMYWNLHLRLRTLKYRAFITKVALMKIIKR